MLAVQAPHFRQIVPVGLQLGAESLGKVVCHLLAFKADVFQAIGLTSLSVSQPFLFVRGWS